MVAARKSVGQPAFEPSDQEKAQGPCRRTDSCSLRSLTQRAGHHGQCQDSVTQAEQKAEQKARTKGAARRERRQKLSARHASKREASSSTPHSQDSDIPETIPESEILPREEHRPPTIDAPDSEHSRLKGTEADADFSVLLAGSENAIPQSSRDIGMDSSASVLGDPVDAPTLVQVEAHLLENAQAGGPHQQQPPHPPQASDLHCGETAQLIGLLHDRDALIGHLHTVVLGLDAPHQQQHPPLSPQPSHLPGGETPRLIAMLRDRDALIGHLVTEVLGRDRHIERLIEDLLSRDEHIAALVSDLPAGDAHVSQSLGAGPPYPACEMGRLLHARDARISHLLAEVQDRDAHSRWLADLMLSSDSKIAGMQQQLSDCHARMCTHDAHTAGMKQEFAQCRVHIAAMCEATSARDGHIAGMEQELHERKSEVLKLTELLRAMKTQEQENEHVRSREAEAIRLSEAAAIAKHAAQSDSLRVRLEEEEAAAQRTRTKCTELESELRSAVDRCDELDAQNQRLMDEVKKARSRAAAAEGQCKDLGALNLGLKDDLKKAQARAEEAAAEAEDLTKRLEGSDALADAHRLQLQEAKDYSIELEGSLSTLQEEAEVTDEFVYQVLGNCEDAEAARDEATALAAKYLASLEEAKRTVTELEDSLASAEGHAEQLKADADESANKIEDMEMRVYNSGVNMGIYKDRAERLERERSSLLRENEEAKTARQQAERALKETKEKMKDWGKIVWPILLPGLKRAGDEPPAGHARPTPEGFHHAGTGPGGPGPMGGQATADAVDPHAHWVAADPAYPPAQWGGPAPAYGPPATHAGLCYDWQYSMPGIPWPQQRCGYA